MGSDAEMEDGEAPVAPNEDFVFLIVATVPVFLSTVFKYGIFRYLNRISPSTVAIYHNLID